MNNKKRKKHTAADRLRYMHMLEEGKSVNWIHTRYGMSANVLTVLWARYQRYGISAITEKRHMSVTNEEKKKIVLDIEKNHITLPAASLKYGPSTHQIGLWLRLARRDGIDALDRIKKRGKPPGMGRPKKNNRPLTELEKLQKENQELKTQMALLKKVRALVEEREARLKGIGLGSSMD